MSATATCEAPVCETPTPTTKRVPPKDAVEWLQWMIDTSKAGMFPSVQMNRDGTFDRCAYRGSNGRMCVAGPFIPDEKYHPDLEAGIYGMLAAYKEINREDLTLPVHKDIVRAAQIVHDDMARIIFASRPQGRWNHDEFITRLRGINGLTDAFGFVTL